MKMIPASRVPEFLKSLGEKARVYAPIAQDGLVVLKEWEGEELATDYINTDNSLKEALYPQTETILEFEGGYEDLSVREAPDPGNMVVFGTRPCDAAGLAMSGRVFLEGDFTDEVFKRKREAAVVMSVACEKAGPYCFCRAMGGSPAGERGSDLMFYPSGEDYYVEALTPKGEELLSAVTGLLSEAPEALAEEAKNRSRSVAVPRAEGLALDGFGEKMKGSFDHPCWEELSKRCHSCGICAFICPTCYCFAVFDAPRGTRGKRMRGWDSCQYEEFLLMAGGHNPRPTKKERVRQRFMHKLSYFMENYGEYQCTGCGRCVAKCPVGLHILGVINDLEGVV